MSIGHEGEGGGGKQGQRAERCPVISLDYPAGPAAQKHPKLCSALQNPFLYFLLGKKQQEQHPNHKIVSFFYF